MTPPAGSFWKVVGVFVIVGPAVGGLAAAAGLLVDRLTLSDAPFGAEQILALPLAVLMGYPYGAVPAILTGVVCGGLSARIRSKFAWVAISIPIGAAFSAIVVWAAEGAWFWTLLGAAAALASSLVALQVRPRSRN